MDGEKHDSLVEIRDISVSAFLYCLPEIKFVGRRRLPSGEVLFQFSPKERAERLVGLYWNLQAPVVQPKVLFGALRDLKDIIFSG